MAADGHLLFGGQVLRGEEGVCSRGTGFKSWAWRAGGFAESILLPFGQVVYLFVKQVKVCHEF